VVTAHCIVQPPTFDTLYTLASAYLEMTGHPGEQRNIFECLSGRWLPEDAAAAVLERAGPQAIL
jgi:hypothetical protein